MQIFVKCGGEATAYDVDPSMSVEALKNEIENKEFIPSSLISLANNSGVIAGGSLAGNDIEDSDELELVLEVQGGMRKKWRKKRMRRLRRKRRKMRQRAR